MAILLKTLALVFRFIEFACSVVVLAIFAYFAAIRRHNDVDVGRYIESVLGMSGVGILYTFIAFLLVCCLGGIGFFAILGFLLDILFVGVFIYIAYESRGGAGSCNGYVSTYLGSGYVTESNPGFGQGRNDDVPSLRNSCRLETATFAVSIIALFFFLLSAFLSIATWRSDKAENKYGPSPANNYTSGRGRRNFWQRKPKYDAPLATGARDNTLPVHQTPADLRTSYATDNTVVGTEAPYNKYGTTAPVGNATNY